MARVADQLVWQQKAEKLFLSGLWTDTGQMVAGALVIIERATTSYRSRTDGI